MRISSYTVRKKNHPQILVSDDFLHTTIEDAILISPTFKVNDATICIQMFIGLCAECEAHVFLRDSTTNTELEKAIVKSSKTAVHGLPTWQSVKIKKNLTSTGSLVVQVIPKLTSRITSNPLWAIANVRECPSTGTKALCFFLQYL